MIPTSDGRAGVPALILIAALALTATACDPTGQVCTEMGCSSGLTVEITGTVADSYTVKVDTEDGESWLRQCRRDEPCNLFFPDFTPPAVTVAYRSELGVVERQFSPAYQAVRPNGPGCPPECLTATVVMELDG